jgi:hypothetical protein
MFEILNPTTAKIASLTPRVETHGDEKVPAVSMTLKITGPNTILDLLRPGLLDAQYMAVPDQEQLPGVEVSKPLLRTAAIQRFSVKMPQLSGYHLVVEHGIDESTAIDLHDVKVDKFVVDPFEGGSCEVSFRVGTSDVDETYLGRLGMKLGQEVQITLRAPEPVPEPIDGTADNFERETGADADATDLFAAEHG